jgi:hypothetical protein
VIEPILTSQTHLLKCFMVLSTERLAIQKLALELSGIDRSLEMYNRQQASVVTRFEQHVDHATGGAGLREYLCKTVDEAAKQMSKLHAKKQILIKQKYVLEMSLMRRARQEIKPMRKYGAEAVLAIRQDLGLPIDGAWFKKWMDSTALALDAALDEYFAELDKKNARRFFEPSSKAPV